MNQPQFFLSASEKCVNIFSVIKTTEKHTDKINDNQVILQLPTFILLLKIIPTTNNSNA